MYLPGRYNLNFDICAASITLCILLMFLKQKRRRNIRAGIFLMICLSLIICSIADCIVVVMRNDPALFDMPLAYAGNMIMHYFHNLIPYLFALYVIYFTGASHYIHRSLFIALSIPALILTVFLFVPPLQRMLYVIEPDGTYEHEAFYGMFIALTVFYFAVVIALLNRWRKALENEASVLAWIIPAGVAVMLISGKFTYLRASNFFISLFVLYAFFKVEDRADIHDPLTGLQDAASFEQDSRILFTRNTSSSVITVKMQNLNYDRVAYGVQNTTLMMQNIAAWLDRFTGNDLKAYYIGNGHFVLLLYGEHQKDGMDLAEKIRQRFEEPWDAGNVEIFMPTEVWFASIPEHIQSQEQLILSAEEPTDPSNRQDGVIIANESSIQQRRLAVNHAISEGLRENRFRVYFQPIYDTRSRSIRTAEALVRLTDPDLGALSPEEFIKVAEQDGYINAIGLFVFEETCRFYTENHLEEKGISFIEVNLSAVQCMDRHLADDFAEILAKYHLDASHIDLEITESAFIHNRDVMENTIEKLRRLGFTFALDDFGTGFSNYDYLVRFPLSLIKIDKSILWAADRSREGSQILEHVIEMCRDLKRGIVTEGVETEAQRKKLESLGVEYLQGFLYSRPVPEDAFLQFLERMKGPGKA